jgi:hypothetical protein
LETPGLTSPTAMRRILAFSAFVEAGTGVALLVAPALVLPLLIGSAAAEAWLPLGRCFGIALLALAVACWPARTPGGGLPAFRGLLSYNLLVALYLATLGAGGQWKGLLLWPAVVLHALITLALIVLWRRGAVRN